MKLGWSSGKKDFAFAITALSQEQSACGANRRYAISQSLRHEDVGSSEEPHAGEAASTSVLQSFVADAVNTRA